VHSFRLFVSAGIAAMLAFAPAFGQTPARVRGAITAIDDSNITVKEWDGTIFTLKTGPYTAYAYVVPSSLDAIKVNDFVGSAVKGSLRSMVAVELAIIPEDMQAGRISIYGWDPLPDPTALHTSDTTATRMTNGLVSKVSPVPLRTKSNRANDVGSAENGGPVGLTLKVTYEGGRKSFRITVPPNAPIVRYVLSDRAAIAIGSAVMVKTNPGDHASLVTVGKGVTPPM
jgi:hypothetical protein